VTFRQFPPGHYYSSKTGEFTRYYNPQHYLDFEAQPQVSPPAAARPASSSQTRQQQPDPPAAGQPGAPPPGLVLQGAASRGGGLAPRCSSSNHSTHPRCRLTAARHYNSTHPPPPYPYSYPYRCIL
jgi:hypothetical protein